MFPVRYQYQNNYWQPQVVPLPLQEAEVQEAMEAGEGIDALEEIGAPEFTRDNSTDFHMIWDGDTDIFC